jgi:hypothetical protein
VNPEAAPEWDESSWSRGKADTERWAKDRQIPFGLLVTIFAAAVGVLVGLVPDDVSVWLRVLIGVSAGIVGFFVVVLLLAAWFTLRAPYEQRDEARAELTRRREIHDLLELDKQLRAIREANSRILGEVKDRGLTGPLGEDEDPWVRGQNENLGLWLESNGFPELVPELVISEPKLGTWEGVIETAREIDTNLTRVLEGERLADVRHLRNLGPSLLSPRGLGTGPS